MGQQQEHIQQTTEQVFNFIRDYIHQYGGLAPSQREIALACYLGESTVLRYLDRLEAKGRIIRHLGKARSITLPEDYHESE